jgi:peptidoglycan/LPS O-acetylase OafA/YrhL
MSSSATSRAHRKDIQGLRAIAVLLVLVFHVWPAALPGGYVGVDVFFVISGYLITGLLLRELETTGSVSLAEFYARRIARLLPAAAVVLALTALLIPLLPQTMWKGSLFEVLSSSLYVENWRLATQAVDYLAAEDSASPVQHFWSLSIEEQFYLFWPLLILGAKALSKDRSWPLRSCLKGFLSLVIILSLAFSILQTYARDETAYFATQTRIWELGFGGMIALWGAFKVRGQLSSLMTISGLALIFGAAMAFGRQTPFPGAAALVPVVGTVLILIGNSAGELKGPLRILAIPAFQVVGDLSYSLYLWHWPIVVWWKAVSGRDLLLTLDGSIVIALSFALAFASKRWIEDPFRPGGARRLGWPGAIGFSLAPVALSLASYVGYVMPAEIHRQVPSALYPGAESLAAGASVPKVNSYAPSLAFLKDDQFEGYELGCHVGRWSSAPKFCRYGSASARYKIMLVGDSHAANWAPALKLLAQSRDWHLTVATKSGCSLVDRVIDLGGRPYKSCLKWGRSIVEEVRRSVPDVLLVTNIRQSRLYEPDVSKAQAVENFVTALGRTWSGLHSDRTRIIALVDTPRVPIKLSERCLRDPADCSTPKGRALKIDPIRLVGIGFPKIDIIDMNHLFCDDHQCPAVIGNVLVWRDSNHFTASYSASAANELGRKMDEILGR